MERDKSHHKSWQDVTTAITAEPLPSASRDKACLVVLAGGPLGEMVAVGEGLTVGRGAQADFRIADEGVSRLHLRMERQSDGSIRVIDLASRNGTYINGKRIDKAVLHDGDKLYIGTGAILRFSYADRLEESVQQQLYEAALRDPLTGLFNRRHLLAQLQAEFQFVQRHGTPLSLVMIDIDHFKRVNDAHGHLIGDATLHAFGELLRYGTRSGDTAARFGGEEFVIVCRGVGGASGVRVAVRLQQSVRNRPLIPDLPDLFITFSAGVASAPSPHIGDSTELLQAADRALHSAKCAGRDRVVLYAVTEADQPE